MTAKPEARYVTRLSRLRCDARVKITFTEQLRCRVGLASAIMIGSVAALLFANRGTTLQGVMLMDPRWTYHAAFSGLGGVS